MPNPEPRIMTTAELEHLRDRLDSHRGEIETLTARVLQLESRRSLTDKAIESFSIARDALERVQREHPEEWVQRYEMDDGLVSMRELTTVRQELADVSRERDALREALSSLRLYVKSRGHDVRSCQAVYGEKYHCTCGLAAALATATPAPGGSE